MAQAIALFRIARVFSSPALFTPIFLNIFLASRLAATHRNLEANRQPPPVSQLTHPRAPILPLTSLLMANIVERVCYRHMEMLTTPSIGHDYYCYYYYC